MPQIQLLAAGPQSSAQTADHLPHVLFIVDGFPKALGGGERVVLRLASLLPAYGFRASILTFALHPESSFQPEAAPCPVYLLPLTNTYGLHAMRSAFALRRFLRQQKVQVVQTFFESSDIWGGAVTRLLSPAKLIWSRRDMGILRGTKHQAAYRALRRFPHAVCAVSERVRRHVIEVDRVPASRVHVVHNGLDLNADKQAGLRDGRPPVITTVGNIRHVKGHDLLVQAAATVIKRFPEAQFTVAGDVLEPEYFRALQQQVKALQLEQNFHFIGKISDLQTHFNRSSIFVLPSRSEGFSNALVEAMAAGLPSVATDVGGNAEAIEDGSSGLIIPPESADALATALIQLLENPALAATVGTAGRLRVEQHFSSEAMMTKLTGIFFALLGNQESLSSSDTKVFVKR